MTIKGSAARTEPVFADIHSQQERVSREHSGTRPAVRPAGGATPTRAKASSRVPAAVPPPSEEGLDCLGVRVSVPNWELLRDWFYAAARRRGHAKSLYFVNAHTLNLAWRDPAFRDTLNRGDVVLNDGIGLDLYAKLAGASFRANFNGTDLFPRLFATADPKEPLRVFLYGALPGRAELAKAVIESRFPGVRVVGTMDGFQREHVVETINEACPHVLLVGMGNPIQEKWIDDNKELLDVGVVAGVGALIDFMSGRVSRAPLAFRRAKLEWLYRLAIEPKRMFRRYVLGNPAFLVRALVYTKLTTLGRQRRGAARPELRSGI